MKIILVIAENATFVAIFSLSKSMCRLLLLRGRGLLEFLLSFYIRVKDFLGGEIY